MADTLQFGPEWLRALSDGNNIASPPSSPGLKKFKIAEFRYGREEMLALYDKANCQKPDTFLEFADITLEKSQQPLALSPLSEEEQRCWSKCVNSEIVLRLANRGGSTANGPAISRSGGTGITRGGSVDRGRGRGRSSFYSRNLADEVNSSDLKDPLTRPVRSFDRSLSLTDRNQPWDEKERKLNKDFIIHASEENGLGSTRKDCRPPDNWRADRDEGDEDSGWRNAKTKGDKWHRPTWRTHENRPTEFNQNVRNELRPFKNRFGDEIGDRDQLPEWSKDDDFECVGTFDSSGAFRENQQLRRKSEEGFVCKNDVNRPKNQSSKLSEIRNSNSEEIPVKESSPVNNTPNSRSQNSDNKSSINDEQWDEEGSKNDEGVSSSSSSLSSNNSSSSETNKQTNNHHQPFLNPKQNVIQNSELLVPKTDSSVVPQNGNHQQKTSNTTMEIMNQIKRSKPDFDHLKAAESLMATITAEEEAKLSSINNLVQSAQTPLERIVSVPLHHENAFKWLYKDPQGKVQGPFSSEDMSEWFNAGYFSMNLLVRRGCDDKFMQLGELMKLWGRSPFSNGQNPPPMKSNPVKEPIVPHVPESSMLKSQQQEEDLRMYQQHPLYYQMVQQQMLQDRHQSLLRQQLQAMIQIQPEGFNLLTPQQQQQQQQLLLQLLISRQLQQQRSSAPTTPIENPGPNDMQQFMSKLSAANLPAGLWPNVHGPSVWDIDNRSQSEPVQQNTAAIISNIEGLQRREEERKAKEQKELEERRLAEAESLRKAEDERLEVQRQQELRRQQELIRQEEERRKEEELQHQEEERQHLEKLRLQKEKEEEERKRNEIEHQRQLEELRKQEQLRKEEERRKLEEQKNQEILQEMEEMRQLELRRVAEERKKEKELERQKELERKRAIEFEKQKECIRELEENARKIQEMKNRQQTSPWGSSNASHVNAAPSLAEIQKLQEEREQKERLEKHKLMMQQHEKLAVLQQQQQMKNNLTWANNTQVKGQETKIKSLAEIQKEEEAVSKQQLEQVKQNTNLTSNLPLNVAGVWGNASNQLNWNPNENENHLNPETFSAGFWDEPKKKAPAAKKCADPAFPVLGNQSKSQKKNSNQSNKTKSRSKKEEENVLKLFESKTSKLDDLTKWCYEALSNLNYSVHVPTFIGFLKDVESPYEVEDYVKSFLGESKELKDFTKQYLERRSKQRNQVNNSNHHEENMWGPAPAIMPSQNKVSNHDDNSKNSSSSKKKKKGKMQKLDSSVLGFTVYADPTRLNVGEIDHVDSNVILK